MAKTPKSEPQQAAEERKLRARDAFREYLESALRMEFGRSTKQQQSEMLVRFYLDEIHNRLDSPYVDLDGEFDAGWVDMASDLGCDFIHRDDGRVLIIQAKALGQDKGVSAEDVDRFRLVLQRLEARTAYKANAKVDDIAGQIDWSRDTFVCKFVAMGKIEGQGRVSAGNPMVLPEVAGLQERHWVEYLDERLLDERLRQAVSATQGISSTKVELFSTGKRGQREPIIAVESGDHVSYIMVVDARQLVNVYQRKDMRESLFALNIRNFLGRTDTNRAIREAAEKRPEEFFYLNNGVSCLATDVEIDEARNALIATGLQVINGAQTIRSLVTASGAWKSDPLVLVRITEAENYGQHQFRDRLVEANNTQNVIKDSDFRSNDPVHRQLKTRFAENRRFGRPVLYVPKRTDQIRQGAEVVRLEPFAKAVYGFLCNPAGFSGSTSFLFDLDKPGYRAVFVDLAQMSREEFELRAAIWWMSVEFNQRLTVERKQEQDKIKRAALERQWWLLTASRHVLELSFGGNYAPQLRKHFEGNWKLGHGEVGDWFLALYSRAKVAIQGAYSRAYDRDNFVHRNWMRSGETEQLIARALEEISEFSGAQPLPPAPKRQ